MLPDLQLAGDRFVVDQLVVVGGNREFDPFTVIVSIRSSMVASPWPEWVNRYHVGVA